MEPLNPVEIEQRIPKQEAKWRINLKAKLKQAKTIDELRPLWGTMNRADLRAEFKRRAQEIVVEKIAKQDNVESLVEMREMASRYGLSAAIESRIYYLTDRENHVIDEVETVTPEVVDDGTA